MSMTRDVSKHRKRRIKVKKVDQKTDITIVYYVPRRTMRIIARRATMLAGDRSQGVVEA